MSNFLSDALRESVEAVYDGWYPEGPIDWEDFVDRVEAHSGQDLGDSMLSVEIRAIKAHVRKLRRAADG